MKRSAICRLLIQALLFAGSALSVFWLAGGFDRDTAKRKRSVISTPPGGSQRVAKGKLSALSGAGSTADFIAGLRGAGVDEMRQAFLTTHNHTLRSAIVARWAAQWFRSRCPRRLVVSEADPSFSSGHHKPLMQMSIAR